MCGCGNNYFAGLFMKKFTKILVCLMLCVFGLGLVACDNRTTKEQNFTYPKSSDHIYGNGGLAVRKGRYVYFVNGYKSITTEGLSKKTKYNVGSLMLMKLNANGELVTDENGLVDDDYYITMSNKLCGYEVTDLFIHGDYLYFVTPCLENETGDEVWAKERVVFKRIKLDKTGEVEEVYQSNVKYDQLEYKYYETKNNLYILAWEKGKAYYDGSAENRLVRINATKKTKSKISNDVSSVVFAENSNEIFFVYDDEEDYDVKKYDIVSNKKSTYIANLENTVTLKFVGDGKLYATQSHENDSTYTDLVVSNFESGEQIFSLFYSNVKDYDLSITLDGSAVVLVKENVISLINTNLAYGVGGATINATIQEAEGVTAIDVVDYTNGCVLYYTTTSDGSSIKLASYSNALDGKVVEPVELTAIDSIEEEYAYFDLNEEENCLYFYKVAGSSATEYYLHRLKVNNNFGETEEMFGVYEKGDEPEVEETEDEELEEE